MAKRKVTLSYLSSFNDNVPDEVLRNDTLEFVANELLSSPSLRDFQVTVSDITRDDETNLDGDEESLDIIQGVQMSIIIEIIAGILGLPQETLMETITGHEHDEKGNCIK